MIVCDGLVKIYKVGEIEVVALQGLELVVEAGELMAIVGASGSGKSTLLNILGGLDTPSAGEVSVAGHDLLHMSSRARTIYRRSVVGFVWQQAARNLLPYLTAHENVRLPMVLANADWDHDERAAHLLEQVGLAHRADHTPAELSGGEQQRAAVAVALANRPEVLFADEPTGELDSGTAAEIFELLRHVNATDGVTVVVVTHDRQIADHVDRTVAIRDGRTSSEVVRRTAAANAETVTEEFAVLDRVGRLQLPADYVEALGLSRRVRLTLESDHIELWPDGGEDER